MDVEVHIDIDEWYPIYTPEKYDKYYKDNGATKIVVDQSLLDRWEQSYEEFSTLQRIFHELSRMQK